MEKLGADLREEGEGIVLREEERNSLGFPG